MLNPRPPSAGVDHYKSLQETLIEALESYDSDDAYNFFTEVVDSFIPSYTHGLWQMFVDTAAYLHESDYDTSEPESILSDMFTQAINRLIRDNDLEDDIF